MGRRMRLTAAPLYIFLLICTCGYAFIPGVDGPVSNVETLEGGNVTLFCDSTPDSADDEFMILVWYKNNMPIYSFEIPNKQWSEPSFNTSSRLQADIRSQPTAVTISSLSEEDQAMYHCRVDFRLSPTRNVGINVTVVVLPSPPFFMDEMSNKVTGRVGPYHDGDTLVLRCLVIGGRPPPRISWYSGDTMVDASDGDSEIPAVRENELYLPLTRDNAAALSCRAQNTELAPPIVAVLEVELYLPAYNVSIHWVRGTVGDALRAGSPALAHCTARGSYPQPELSWWLDRKHLTHHSNQSWFNSSLTAISFLELNPAVGDNGATLACVATNPVMAPNRGSNADVITLNVTYSPMVDIMKLGDGKLNDVVELDPLQLKCDIKANPPLERIRWYFNDIEIKAGGIWGDDISSEKLFVEEATRAHAGRYSCAAENAMGETRSDTIVITVFYPPECTGHGIRLVKESLHCYVKALPIPDTFFWHLQPSGFEVQHLTTGSPILPLDQITGPLGDTLRASCEANNDVASQEEACDRTFTFEHLRPQQPQQCDIAYEFGEFQMRCVPVENATYYEVSVWRMSESNASLVLERRASMGFGGGRALAAGGAGGAGAGARGPAPRAALGRVRRGDEAGARACNRYGCSRPLLLRPSDTLLRAADPPWWHVFLEKDVGISIGAVILVAVFIISSVLLLRLARRPRRKPPVIQVLQLDDVARNYLDNIAEHKVRASCSLRSCSSGYSDASVESAGARRKPWERWEPPPPDVTLTLHRESAV
ncbi:hemicentin-2-like isoform X2 [Trichoplusia ni]|uniref:Hemicentin-2-like isoform X2 n=1 Tax=Trichoplusia ni TaxID=7111 RepID=A0A7E5W160_TRINI|nr:hemicentin-2-like isoform X2 [Trichoplusia ni]